MCARADFLVRFDDGGDDGYLEIRARTGVRASRPNDKHRRHWWRWDWDDKLQNVTVVTRLVSLSRRRRFALFLFVVVPQMLIAFTLGITGGWYLALATNQGELILNVVALGFVISLDEGLYRCLVPGRVCIALFNMEPLRVKSSKVPPSSSLVKLVFFGSRSGEHQSRPAQTVLRQALPRPENTLFWRHRLHLRRESRHWSGVRCKGRRCGKC